MSNNELFLYIGFACFFFAFIAFLQFLRDDYDIVMKEFRERVSFFAISIIVGFLCFIPVTTSTQENTIKLKPIPEQGTYYTYQESDKTIRYLDGSELKSMKANSCKVLFDINDDKQPYMVKTDNYNVYGNKIQTEVVVHLNSLETQE